MTAQPNPEAAPLPSIRDVLEEFKSSADDGEAAIEAIFGRFKLACGIDAPGTAKEEQARLAHERRKAALEAAANAAGSDIDPAMAFREALGLTHVMPLSRWANEESPETILWRDWHDETEAYPLLGVGEVGVMSGEGSSGKTTMALALGDAAHRTLARGGDKPAHGAACGLRIKPGSVAFLSYEASPRRLYDAFKAQGGDPTGLTVAPWPQPLLAYEARAKVYHDTAYASELWALLASHRKPVLVVVDTGPKAIRGERTDEAAVVAALQQFEAAGAEGGWATLVLAHDTKQARASSRAGGDPSVGAVAGTGQWFDTPRAVLHVSRTGPGQADRLVFCAKANLAPDGWGAVLQACNQDEHGAAPGRFAGFQLERRLDARDVVGYRNAQRTAGGPGDNPPRARKGERCKRPQATGRDYGD